METEYKVHTLSRIAKNKMENSYIFTSLNMRLINFINVHMRSSHKMILKRLYQLKNLNIQSKINGLL